MSLKKITLEELIAKFDPSVHEKIRRIAGKEGTTHMVLFENVDFSSSRFGACSALAIGPGNTYRTLEEVENAHLGDLPSERKYPTAYVEK